MARKIAIIYDFDNTLAPGNMHDHSFFPALGIDKDEFWTKVRETAEEHDMDQILTYMQLMIEALKAESKSISRNEFTEHGRSIKLFQGLEPNGEDQGWFERMGQYGRREDIEIEHYIISSGLREMIDGTPIKGHFKEIYASKFKYTPDQTAEWPALAINYTSKTQYLFRINKGIPNSWDDAKINKFTRAEDRPIPFSNMIYIGDGDTDIPCMKMIRHQGGYSLAVYDPGPKDGIDRRKPCQDLLEVGRADYAAAADYRSGSRLEKIIFTLIRKIAAELDLRSLTDDKRLD